MLRLKPDPRRRRSRIASQILLASLALFVALPSAAGPVALTRAGPGGGTLGQTGRWSPPFDIGAMGTHMTVLPGGGVLVFSQSHGQHTEAVLWNPQTGDSHPLHPPRELFCSGHSLLPSGHLFVAGGHADNNDMTSIFNPNTHEWRAGPRMTSGRYYPTTIERSDGTVLIVAGASDHNRLEVYDPTSDTIQALPDAVAQDFPLYPRLHLLPDGRVFSSGPQVHSLALSAQQERWELVAKMGHGRRNHLASVLLPLGPGRTAGQVMAIGGFNDPMTTETVEIIDFSASSPSWRYTSPLSVAREFHNAVLLADGTVLVVGGERNRVTEEPALDPELFDPATESWRTMATQGLPRGHHAAAVLLPDGRVLSAGGHHGDDAAMAEIFSPPYLFRGNDPAPRPAINSVTANLAYGNRFRILTKEAASIAGVALVRPESSTHGVAFDQRYVRLDFTRSSGRIRATAPSDARIAPPGWYMLFLVDQAGVPSVARWVRLS